MTRLEHKTHKEWRVFYWQSDFPTGGATWTDQQINVCDKDCPACVVEKYRKDVLEKIKARLNTYCFLRQNGFLNEHENNKAAAQAEALDELIKELE